MRIQVLSDLHHEFYRARGVQIPDIENAGADVVILAGDIDVGTSGVEWAVNQANRLQTPVLYIAGNHEFYGRCHEETREELKRTAEGSRVSVLENEAIVLGNVRFLCATLWSDFRAMGAQGESLSMRRAAREIADYRTISRHLPGSEHRALTPADTLSWHIDSLRWLTEELNGASGLKTVVVTHHGASPGCHNRQLWGEPDPISGSFWSDMDNLIASSGASCWIYGHTHSNLRFEVEGVRVVCNQRGYLSDRGECPGFDSKYTVEI